MACDDFVVARTGSAGGYARSLARMHDLRSSKGTRLLAPALLGRNVSLADRIESLLRRGREFSTRPSLAKLGVSALLLAVLLGAGGLLPGWIAVAQTAGGRSGKVWTILRQAGERYSRLKSYRFAGTLQMTLDVKDSRYRFTDLIELASEKALRATRCRYRRYHSAPIKKIAGNGPVMPGLSYGLPGPDFYRFEKLPGNVASASLLGEGTTVANGKKEQCFLIRIRWSDEKGKPEITKGSAETLWVAESSHLVLRATFSKFNFLNPRATEHWVTIFNSYQLDGPAPQWLLGRQESIAARAPGPENRFLKKMLGERLSTLRALSARMTGKQAPAFTLKDLHGNTISLAALRGKVVLLDFWATWCAPCRKEETVIEKVESEWRPSSLAVLRITNEAPKVIQRYLQDTRKNFSTLVDGKTVSQSYEVRGLPTLVVVSKSGKIVLYHADFLDESELAADLKKAGA